MDKKKKGIIAVLILVIIVCAVGIVSYFVKQNKAKDENKKIQKIAKEETEEKTDDEVSIDFEALQQQNADIYAWIRIPETQIDYPILQHPSDDAYYLNHTVEGTEGLPGSIYTEKVNSKDFTDFNTVIYGHNMKNGTMFKDLHKYEEEAFFKENPYVYIYLPDKTLKYHIVAAVTFDDRYIPYSYDFSKKKECQKFLDDVQSGVIKNAKAVYAEEQEITTDDKIITMSICIANQNERRWIVVAKLEEDSTQK